MDPIQELRTRLERHPELRFWITSRSLEVERPSDTGFEVSLHAADSEYVVSFEGWHEHFASAEEALNCFAFAYSGKCRLAVTYRGQTAVKWVLEHYDGFEWRFESEVGIFVVPFWRRARVVYRQNPNLLRAV